MEFAFCMSQLTMMYLRSFLVFAQLIILFGIVLLQQHLQKRVKGTSQMFFATFAENHFLYSWAYERHRKCTKLKGSLKNRLLLASYAQSGAIGNPSWYNGNGPAFSKSFTSPTS